MTSRLEERVYVVHRKIKNKLGHELVFDSFPCTGKIVLSVDLTFQDNAEDTRTIYRMFQNVHRLFFATLLGMPCCSGHHL